MVKNKVVKVVSCKYRLRVVPLLLSLLSEMRKTPARQNGLKRSWGRVAFARPFFLAGFFHVSLNRLNERGTTHSITKI